MGYIYIYIYLFILGGDAEPPKSRFCAYHIERSLYTCAVNHIPCTHKPENKWRHSIKLNERNSKTQMYSFFIDSLVPSREARGIRFTAHVYKDLSLYIEEREREKRERERERRENKKKNPPRSVSREARYTWYYIWYYNTIL